jgi:hypothetical protein
VTSHENLDPAARPDGTPCRRPRSDGQRRRQYVFLIEDDGVLPPDALSRLLADYKAHPYALFIEGVELGRWGSP